MSDERITPIGPRSLRAYAGVVENVAPPTLRRSLESAADQIETLRNDRDLLVRALREVTHPLSDEGIAFRFDAPGARLHGHLLTILRETASGSSVAES